MEAVGGTYEGHQEKGNLTRSGKRDRLGPVHISDPQFLVVCWPVINTTRFGGPGFAQATKISIFGFLFTVF